MSTRVFSKAFWLCLGLLGGCPFFTAGEPVDAPNPSQVKAAAAAASATGGKPDHGTGAKPPMPPQRPAAAAGESATASHILVTHKDSMRGKRGITRSKDEAKALAEKVLKRAAGGEDFEVLAKEFSDGPSGPRGGKLGTFTRGRMVPAFDKAVFGMKAGEVSGELVETPFGYHIIYREK